MQYFYSAQIRRFIIQTIRYLSQFQVEFDRDQNGNAIYLTVPVRYADTNRAVASIINNNSENTMANLPMMVCYIDSLKYDRDRIQDPSFVEKRRFRELDSDPISNEPKTYQRNAFTVERIMPVPYKLSLKLDICTTSTDQKLQLIEQISVWFNPSREIQNSDTYLDWTSLTTINLVDLNFSSRSIPIGTEEPLDVATFTFEIPIWITPPAKIKKLNAVQGIVASIFDANGNLAQAIEDQYQLLGKRQWFTPSGYNTIVANGQIILSQHVKHGTKHNLDMPEPSNAPISWRSIINYMGELSNGISQIAFVNETTENAVIGTISYHPTDDSILLFDTDPSTTPTNSLPAVTNIIDPLRAGPGAGLPAAAIGQRYLIINNSIGNVNNSSDNNPSAWRNADNSPIFANANDIIEYNGANWNVIFDSNSSNSVEYVTNIYSGIQYKWLNKKWQKSWEGLYLEGQWLLII